ncbi:SLD7 [Candida margitis]|uniref:SLD7 n=1 Tax=Candida margitis TaxID=1775924 RepID=UPI0022275B4E|nr:SLD7 [Candida margitis]KAI5968874.1 SLD7 [Candida margitis]
MNFISTTVIHDANRTFNDVQFWSDQSNPAVMVDSCECITYINCNKIPIYLISGKSFSIFSNDSETELFFKEKIIQAPSKMDFSCGLLTIAGKGKCIVFYYENQMKCLLLDFTKLEQMRNSLKIEDAIANSFIKPRTNCQSVPAVTAFDRILKKKQESNPFLAVQSKADKSSLLSTQEQIGTAVNKIIQSGLRIRGLSVNQTESINDKLKIKEIYQMTYKATMFSLRKFNYSFNKRAESEKIQVSWSDLQETVENLLHLFIDLD